MPPKHYLIQILIFVTILLSSFSGNAQNSSDPIKMVKRWYGIQYYQNNVHLNTQDLLALTKGHKESYLLINKAHNQRIASYFFGITGGACMGYSIGYALACYTLGNKLERKIFIPVLGIGLCFVTFGISFELSAERNTQKGVKIFSDFIKQNNSTNIKLGFSPSGTTLRVNF